MAPKLITMLTCNDETVNNALSIFRECADLDCDFWGFKTGLSERKSLTKRIKTDRHRGRLFAALLPNYCHPP